MDKTQDPILSIQNSLSILNLTYSYGDHQALNQVEFNMEKGQIIGLLGPNGSGKTTLINLVLGLIKKQDGEIRLFNQKVNSKAVKKRMGVIPQQFSFYPALTVYENVMFFAKLFQVPTTVINQRFDEYSEIFKLKDKKHISAESLSGGMKRRLMLLMSIIHDPDLVLMDEPTAGVDPVLRKEFWVFLQAFAKRGKSILITTHHISEANYCDEVIFIKEGKILEKETPERELLIVLQ